MGKKLIIKGADFSTNGTYIVDPDAEKLNKIKSVIESHYYEHKRYTAANQAQQVPTTTGDTRNSFGYINASSFDYVPFIITPKTGCKIVPLQCDAQQVNTKFAFEWTTEAATFNNFSAYQMEWIGANLAYSNDGTIPTGTSVWDFIDIALAE